MRYPVKFVDDNRKVLLLDTVFAAKEYLEYAIAHNMSVKLEDTTSTSAVEVIYNFVKEGFTVSFSEEEVFSPDGLKLRPRIIVYLKR